MTLRVPELVTDRLVLRGMRRADFADFAAIWGDADVVRFILPAPRDETTSWRAFLANAGSWAIDGIGQWAVTERDSGRYVGQTGFFDGRRGLGSDFGAAPECGWVFARAVWGRGYAGEAVAAAHRWFDAQGKAEGSRVMITIGHVVSERVAAAAGYRPMRAAVLDGTEVTLFRRDQARARKDA